MKESDEILIEKYLAQELTAAERIEVELRAQNEAAFRLELDKYTHAMDALKLAQRDELKRRFRERDKILDKQTNVVSLGRNRNRWILTAAAVIALIVMLKFLTVPERSSDHARVEPKDTTIIQSPPKDTISPIVKKQPEKPAVPSSKERGREIFAANFESYTDESLDPASRSDETELTAREKFELYYWEKNYREAIDAFNAMDEPVRQNDNYRFLYANALMSVNRINEATGILTDVIQNPKSIYKSEALYYRALCALKNGKLEEAKKDLKVYIDEAEATQRDRARKMLAMLE